MKPATTPTTTDLQVFPTRVDRLGAVCLVEFVSIDQRAPFYSGYWLLGKNQEPSDFERLARMKLPHTLRKGTQVHWNDGKGE